MNSLEKHMNQFTIGYMVNPALNFNKVFRDQFEKILKETFNSSAMSGIKKIIGKDNTCVIALVMFYENITMNPMKVFRVLSCVVYSVIDHYVFVGYLCCQSNELSAICSDKYSWIVVIPNCLVFPFQKF